MIKKMLLLILLLVLANSIFATQLAPLTGVNRPDWLIVDNERVYVVERTTIFVYSLKDYKLLAKFGKKGEGPQEFKVRPSGDVKIYPLGDFIYCDSIGKVSAFKKNGEFVSETKAITGQLFRPITHKRFVGEGTINEGKTTYRTIDIFDENLKKVTTVFRQPHINQGAAIRVYFSALAFKTIDEKIIVTGREGLTADAYDKNGKKLFTISRPYEKRKITDKDKKDVLDWFKKDPRYNEQRYQYIKAHIQFPEYFPAIEDMCVSDHKIYLQTFNIVGNLYEFVIYDTDGKYIETVKTELIRENPVYAYPYYIANDNVYQAVEDLDKEQWFLHVKPLK